MSKPVTYSITVNNKKYTCILKGTKKKTSFVQCDAANIKQEFLNKDIPYLLNDLPNLILAEKEYNKQQSEIIRFRVSPEDKKKIEKRALKKGYTSVSGFLRDLALKGA